MPGSLGIVARPESLEDLVALGALSAECEERDQLERASAQSPAAPFPAMDRERAEEGDERARIGVREGTVNRPARAPETLFVEWWRRLEEIYGSPAPEVQGAWLESLSERSPVELQRLGDKYGADYLLTEAEPPLAMPRLYQNNTYAVYDLDLKAD